jgi:hypothetical protein
LRAAARRVKKMNSIETDIDDCTMRKDKTQGAVVKKEDNALLREAAVKSKRPLPREPRVLQEAMQSHTLGIPRRVQGSQGGHAKLYGRPEGLLDFLGTLGVP